MHQKSQQQEKLMIQDSNFQNLNLSMVTYVILQGHLTRQSIYKFSHLITIFVVKKKVTVQNAMQQRSIAIFCNVFWVYHDLSKTSFLSNWTLCFILITETPSLIVHYGRKCFSETDPWMWGYLLVILVSEDCQTIAQVYTPLILGL